MSLGNFQRLFVRGLTGSVRQRRARPMFCLRRSRGAILQSTIARRSRSWHLALRNALPVMEAHATGSHMRCNKRIARRLVVKRFSKGRASWASCPAAQIAQQACSLMTQTIEQCSNVRLRHSLRFVTSMIHGLVVCMRFTLAAGWVCRGTLGLRSRCSKNRVNTEPKTRLALAE